MSGISENPVARFLICGGSAAAINWLARIALSQFMPFAAAVALAHVSRSTPVMLPRDERRVRPGFLTEFVELVTVPRSNGEIGKFDG